MRYITIGLLLSMAALARAKGHGGHGGGHWHTSGSTFRDHGSYRSQPQGTPSPPRPRALELAIELSRQSAPPPVDDFKLPAASESILGALRYAPDAAQLVRGRLATIWSGETPEAERHALLVALWMQTDGEAHAATGTFIRQHLPGPAAAAILSLQRPRPTPSPTIALDLDAVLAP